MPAYMPVEKSKTTVVTNKQRKESPAKIYVGENGYIQNAGYTINPISALEKGAMDGPKAIVLHRTEGTSVAGGLASFKTGVGTHFIVDKDGTVTQTASLLKSTFHVGKIRARCCEESAPQADANHSEDQVESQKKETATIKSWGWNPKKVNDYEHTKAYPARYPVNGDSVGIETVAMYWEKTKTWDPLTAEQSAAISRLVGILKDAYGLGDQDIYEHDKISYKTEGEGAGLYPHDAHTLSPPK